MCIIPKNSVLCATRLEPHRENSTVQNRTVFFLLIAFSLILPHAYSFCKKAFDKDSSSSGISEVHERGGRGVC